MECRESDVPKITAIDKTAHNHIRIDPLAVEGLGANTNMVPIVMAEFLKTATRFPIVFTKNAETGQFSVIALCGFEAGENLFYREGQWGSLYIPLNILRQPFFLGTDNQAEGEEQVICLDLESKCISDDGEPLFTETGDPEKYLLNMQSMLATLFQGEQDTRQFINILIELDLIQKMSLDIKFENGEALSVQGIYTVDETKLNALPLETFSKLRERNMLFPVYSMIQSLGHIHWMVNQRNIRNTEAKAWFKTT
jgi:hypothetical protein